MSNAAIIKRLEALESRNCRVEADKAWETSMIRRASIMVLTYVVVALYLGLVVHINPWINAPRAGYRILALDAHTLIYQIRMACPTL